MDTKKCNKCGLEKNISQFYLSTKNGGKKRPWCKVCESKRCKEYRTSLDGRYDKYRESARVNGIKFTLTKEDFLHNWNVSCTYCGSPIKGIGLDRVDSNLGYELTNVVPCCTICNFMKRKMDIDEFFVHIKKIYSRAV